MIPTRILVTVVLAALLTIGGRLTSMGIRMVDSGPGLEDYRAQVIGLPLELGDWVAREDGDRKLSPDALEQLECEDAYLVRSYANPRFGGVVDVVLMAGPPGPLTSHTPEICYAAHAYQRQSVRRVDIPRDGTEQADELRRLQLKPAQPTRDDLVVIYGWSDGGTWRTPQWPRLAFGHRSAILKIQLALSPDLAGGDLEQERALIGDLLREIRRALQGSRSEEGSPPPEALQGENLRRADEVRPRGDYAG